MPCIIQVIGKKDTGKTSSIERAVSVLKEKGFSVGVIKHSHHEIDVQGKDTYKFWKAGADIVIFNDSKCVAFYRCNLDIIFLLPVDVIIIEGYKELNLGTKIEINSPSEIEEVSRKIVGEAESCQKGFSLVVDGKRVDHYNSLTLLLYNLMKFLNIREAKID
ncbi:MAG: molybdopterin-guanine dinucleotide biosynthesis protein B [Sulfolobus sp.]|nr:molybdopterin-guanine dinucleotide biosynthesis protein B [Sulfolobus sp.]